MAHSIVHVEIATKDPQASAKFYADLFGWPVQHAPEMNYTMFDTQDGRGGGFPKVDGDLYNTGDIMIYVGTDDIEATLAKAESLGATTLVPKSEIPGTGWFAIFRDPQGSRIAIYKSMGQQ